jgi:hypothetical protein
MNEKKALLIITSVGLVLFALGFWGFCIGGIFELLIEGLAPGFLTVFFALMLILLAKADRQDPSSQNV